VFYNIGNTLLVNRDTDDTQSADSVLGVNNYLPGAVPTDAQAAQLVHQLQARSQHAEASAPLELHRRPPVRPRQEIRRHHQGCGR
jgi:hypothetical protein